MVRVREGEIYAERRRERYRENDETHQMQAERLT